MTSQFGIGQILVTILIIAAVVGVALIVRRQLYVRSLRAEGWTFVGSPTLADTYGLNCPPFGLGYSRTIDDLVTGTTSRGIPFRVFEYQKLGYVAVLELPGPLPEAYITDPARPRPGAVGNSATFGRWLVIAKETDYATALMAAIGASVDAMAVAQPVDISIDGSALVALGAPREADQLKDFLQAAEGVAEAVRSGGLERYAAPPPPAELGLYGYPGWILRRQDDSFLSQVVLPGSGYGHEARDVVLAMVHGLRMIGMNHHWKTNRTETSTDSDGNTQTRTVTDHHSESILEFQLPWRFGNLSVNWPGWGNKVRFESADFDRQFTVRCAYPKFASDVMHPRQLDFLLRAQPLPFLIEDGRVRFALGANTPERIAHCAQFIVAFLAGVPAFVWENLGHASPPLSRELDGF